MTEAALVLDSTATGPEVFHYAKRPDVIRGYVEGVEVEALCGVRFVPSRDPSGLAPCEACVVVLDILVLSGGARL